MTACTQSKCASCHLSSLFLSSLFLSFFSCRHPSSALAPLSLTSLLLECQMLRACVDLCVALPCLSHDHRCVGVARWLEPAGDSQWTCAMLTPSAKVRSIVRWPPNSHLSCSQRRVLPRGIPFPDRHWELPQHYHSECSDPHLPVLSWQSRWRRRLGGSPVPRPHTLGTGVWLWVAGTGFGMCSWSPHRSPALTGGSRIHTNTSAVYGIHFSLLESHNLSYFKQAMAWEESIFKLALHNLVMA